MIVGVAGVLRKPDHVDGKIRTLHLLDEAHQRVVLGDVQTPEVRVQEHADLTVAIDPEAAGPSIRAVVQLTGDLAGQVDPGLADAGSASFPTSDARHGARVGVGSLGDGLEGDSSHDYN